MQSSGVQVRTLWDGAAEEMGLQLQSMGKPKRNAGMQSSPSPFGRTAPGLKRNRDAVARGRGHHPTLLAKHPGDWGAGAGWENVVDCFDGWSEDPEVAKTGLFWHFSWPLDRKSVV